MVHTPFTWRYGGRRVFLCGSFNGWSERILMILVDGSTAVFQRILNLPPGCYQYKFMVDDLWRVDEQQLCIRDGHGMINDLVFVTEQEFIPPTIPTQVFQQNPPLDNVTIMPPGASPLGGPLDESVLQLADNDISVLRYHLSVHLSASKAYDLMPDSGKVIALDVDVAVRQAFHVMFKEGVAVVPLWDEQGTQILGMLTASDFILILLQLHLTRATLNDDKTERDTISAWKDLKFQRHTEGIGAPESIYRSLVEKPVGDLPLGTWAREVGCRSSRLLRTLRASDPLSSALTLLIQAEVSSVPIVDGNGSLVNVYGRSDITSLANGNLYTRIRLDQTNISQALEIVDVLNQHRYQTCTRFDSLYRVMVLLSDPVVRRIIVIDARSRRVEGIITLRDVFNFILS